MAIPSLALIPTGFKDGKLYSVLPESGAGDFDVVRGSGATRVNKDGLIEAMTGNEPRLDYTDGGCPSLLLEPQTTQLVTRSEDFSNAVWAKTGDTVIESGYLAPDGNSTAYKISGTNGSIFQPLSLLTTTTRSIYAKTVSGTGTVQLLTHNSNTNILFTITEQWQRFDLNTSNTTGEENFYAVDFRGSGTLSELIIWGANATNDQDYVTSYIPTSVTIATRLADAVTGAGDATTFNSTEGVLYVEMSTISNDGQYKSVSLKNNTTSAYEDTLNITYSAVSNVISAVYRVGTTSEVAISKTLYNSLDFVKCAFKFKNGDFAFWVNGVEEGTDTNTTMLSSGTLNEAVFSRSDGASPFYGKVRDLRVLNTNISDEELRNLTLLDGATLLNGENLADVGDSLLDQNGTQPILMGKYNMSSNQSLAVGGKKMVSGDADSIVNQIQGITNSPKLILIGGGTNDFYTSSPIGNLNSTDTTEYCGAVSFVLDYAIANYPDATILKLGLPFGNLATVNTSADGQINASGLTRSDYMNAEKQLCEDRNIVYVNQLEELGWNASNILDKTYDGVHPIAEGSQDRASLFSTYIDELFPPIN